MTHDDSRVTDVIIIGAGPAGCAAAATCAQAGLSVVMFTAEVKQSESSSSMPSPLESIHPGVTTLLKKIGAEGAEIQATRSMYSGIYAGQQYAALGEDENGIWEGMHINRKVFDRSLQHHIQNERVTIRYHEQVQELLVENNVVIGIRTGTGEWWAKYVIDASGKKAFAGNQLKFRRRFFSPPLLCWTGISTSDDSLSLDQHAAHFIPGKNGWTWLAPQPPHYCAWTRLSLKGEKNMLPPDELKSGEVIGKIQFANMRWRMYRPVCSEGVILCGDAAGILDPAAGQGILNALWSGIIAANTVVACLKEPDVASFHLAYYDNWFVQQFEMKVKRLREYYREHGIDI